MTEEHRQEILKFEAETGIQVLRWLPEGHTFVRPHISPNIGSDELAKLPKFIRVRMEEEIRRALQSDDQTLPP